MDILGGDRTTDTTDPLHLKVMDNTVLDHWTVAELMKSCETMGKHLKSHENNSRNQC